MGWARYDDELPMNHKIGALLEHGRDGVAAVGLHVLCNTWTRHQGLGGFVPFARPGLLLGDRLLGAKLAHLLHEVGMFDDAEGGWQIHDFDDYSDPNDDGRSAAAKKAELSAKRAAAGSKGGKQTASKRGSKAGGLLPADEQQCSSPEPVPAPSLQVSDNSTPENTPAGVDNFDRYERVARRYGVIAVRIARLKGIQVTNEDSYAGKAERRIKGDRELVRVADLFPTAPDDVIAMALHGEKQSLNAYPRADELEPLATVHTLPGRTA